MRDEMKQQNEALRAQEAQMVRDNEELSRQTEVMRESARSEPLVLATATAVSRDGAIVERQGEVMKMVVMVWSVDRTHLTYLDGTSRILPNASTTMLPAVAEALHLPASPYTHVFVHVVTVNGRGGCWESLTVLTRKEALWVPWVTRAAISQHSYEEVFSDMELRKPEKGTLMRKPLAGLKALMETTQEGTRALTLPQNGISLRAYDVT
jgi:hypothetical protein